MTTKSSSKNEIRFESTKDYPVGSKAERETTTFTARKVRPELNSPVNGIELQLNTVSVYTSKDWRKANDRYVQKFSYFLLNAEQVAALKDLIVREVI